MDARKYRLAHRSDIPVFEFDLPVNIERKMAAVQRAIGFGLPLVGSVGGGGLRAR